MPLQPFFTYFGGKYRAAPHYPSPRYGTVIEPFAGSAGYSLRHPERQVILVDKDPLIAALWSWLIRVPEDRIRALPLKVEDVRDLDIEPEAKSLIGFWLNKGTAAPRNRPSKWMRIARSPSGWWGEAIRERVASQLPAIRHWLVFHGSYRDIGIAEPATWFVDPPYVHAGHAYRMGSKQIDYSHLAQWCLSLPGQVMVCEASGADWLPFKPFRSIQASTVQGVSRKSEEVIWTQDPVSRAGSEAA